MMNNYNETMQLCNHTPMGGGEPTDGLDGRIKNEEALVVQVVYRSQYLQYVRILIYNIGLSVAWFG